MLEVKCKGCGKAYKVPLAFAGKKVRCKQCPEVFEIPPATSAPGPRGRPAKNKELEETAVLDASAREEMERSRPATRAGGPGKKPTFPPRAKKVGAAARTGKPLKSARRPVASRFEGRRRGPEGGSEAADPGAPRKSRLLLIGGGGAGVVVLAAAAWLLFLRAPSEPATKPQETAAAAVEESRAARPRAAEKSRAAAGFRAVEVPALSVLPEEAQLVVKIELDGLFELIGVEAGSLALPPEFALMLEQAQLDLTRDIRRLWLAGEIPLTEGVPDLQASGAMILVEGTFDRSSLIAAFQKNGLLGEARREGGLTFYSCRNPESEEAVGELAFISPGQVVIASASYAARLVRLLEEKGKPVTANAALKSLAADFESAAPLWLAASLPPGLGNLLAPQHGEGAPQGPSLPEVEGLFLSLERAGIQGGLAIELVAECASDEEAQKGVNGIVSLQAAAMFLPIPPPLQNLLKKTRASAGQKKLKIRTLLEAQDIEQLQGLAAAFPGMLPGGGPQLFEAGDLPELPPGFAFPGGAADGDGAAEMDDLEDLKDLGELEELEDEEDNSP
jgi:hypothetical protein